MLLCVLQGKLSDTYGRKSFLLLSYIGPFVGYVLMGFSGSILVLVISRIPNGDDNNFTSMS